MEKLVKFKPGIDTLNDEEDKSFLHLYGRNNIITLIFNNFPFEIHHYVANAVDQTNELIYQIIEQHETNDSTQDSKTNHGI